jgi:deoxyribonuclease V
LSLHRWDLTPTEAIALQKRLKDRVLVTPLAGEVTRVAGTDCAFLDGGKRILAVAVVWDVKRRQVVDESVVERPCTYPYVPGLLSFREAPAVLEAVEKLESSWDLLICDGQGRAHPRRLGLASHVGLWLDRPVIGAAKSVLVGEFRTPAQARGSGTQMKHKGEVIGLALRTRRNVKCMYVSVGNRVTLEDARRWTLRCAVGYRLPEPTRQGHLRVTRRKRQRS